MAGPVKSATSNPEASPIVAVEARARRATRSFFFITGA
jgi:hypothetical protein